jgi:hypothetical protein
MTVMIKNNPTQNPACHGSYSNITDENVHKSVSESQANEQTLLIWYYIFTK